jgi:hypothetical protein
MNLIYGLLIVIISVTISVIINVMIIRYATEIIIDILEKTDEITGIKLKLLSETFIKK